MPSAFQCGIDTLLDEQPGLLRGRRVGLVAHPASRDHKGVPTWERLRRARDIRLAAIFGPEHGFLGAAGAGEEVGHTRHPELKVPVYSLYGGQRAPSAEMLEELDVLVFDLQDLGARCYTYLATLYHLLRAAARHGKEVLVADRPIPLPNTIDGPMLNPRFRSFVGPVPLPLAYGMTPGEAARWMKKYLRIKVDLHVAPMQAYHREGRRRAGWPDWVPPSPAIRSWACGQAYLATVFTEALPALDCARRTRRAFQVLRAPWLEPEEVCRAARAFSWPGMTLAPHGRRGVALTVHDPDGFRPVLAGIQLLHLLQRMAGRDRIWDAPGTRPRFFDLLAGTDATRKHLQQGLPAEERAAAWREESERFRAQRERVLLYHPRPPSSTVSMVSERPRRALVLAAGLGTRMAPLTHQVPKALLPLWNRPMLEHTLLQLRDWGVEEATVNAHHLAEQVFAWLRTHPVAGLKVSVSFEPEILGTGGALPRARWTLGEGPCWMVNADVACDLDPAPLLKLMGKPRTLAALWLVPDRGPRTVRLERDRVVSFRSSGYANHYTFSGLQLVSPGILRYLPEAGFASIIEAYEAALSAGRTVRGQVLPGSYWADIGAPDSYLAAQEEVEERGRAGLPGARLYAPGPRRLSCVSGEAVVKQGAVVKRSVVFPGAVLTSRARLQGALLAPDARVSGRVSGITIPADRLSAPARSLLEQDGFAPEQATASFLGARGSQRSFYRVTSGARTAVLVRFDPGREENRLYAGHADWLRGHGLPVPRVLARDESHALLLLEDVGERALEQEARRMPPARRTRIYRHVLQHLCAFHALGERAEQEGVRLMKPFTPSLYAWEAELFTRHYLEQHLGCRRVLRDQVKEELSAVARRLLAVPRDLLHRDLQASNIYLQKGRTTFIDFQGMRMGPAAYDIASLLLDPYVDLAPGERDEHLAWLAEHHHRGREVLEGFWWAGVQRLCQALGAYGRLGRQRGTEGFLVHIPTGVRLLRTALSRVEALPALAESLGGKHS